MTGDLMGKTVNYICQCNPEFDWEMIKKIEAEALPEEERFMESFINESIQEGKEQGMQRGIQQVALSLLKKITDVSFIFEVTGLPKKEIKKLKTKATLPEEDRIVESFIDKAVQKSREKGMKEGIQKVTLNMLKKNTDISLISEVTGLPKAEIKKLKNGS